MTLYFSRCRPTLLLSSLSSFPSRPFLLQPTSLPSPRTGLLHPASPPLLGAFRSSSSASQSPPSPPPLDPPPSPSSPSASSSLFAPLVTLTSTSLAAVTFGPLPTLSLVSLLLLHEYGHYKATRSYALSPSRSFFFPFSLTFWRRKAETGDVVRDGWIAMAGPLVGGVSTILLSSFGIYADSLSLLSAAHFSFAYTGLALLPLRYFDGGRVVAAMSRRQLYAALAACFGLFVQKVFHLGEEEVKVEVVTLEKSVGGEMDSVTSMEETTVGLSDSIKTQFFLAGGAVFGILFLTIRRRWRNDMPSDWRLFFIYFATQCSLPYFGDLNRRKIDELVERRGGVLWNFE
jgi:hypothetical protein